MRYISLFAGIGGFDLGFEQAGWECVARVEIDKAAAGVLAHRLPGSPLFCDIKKVQPSDLPDADALLYGFPCTDLSVAGMRGGLQGARSGLFYEAIRLVRGLRRRGSCQLAVAENVVGLLTADDGTALQECIRELTDLGHRETGWTVLDSQYFGVPQRRRRLFIVTDFAGERTDEILSISESLRGHPAAGREAGKGITTDLEGSPPSSCWAEEVECEGCGCFWEQVGPLESCPMCGTIQEAKLAAAMKVRKIKESHYHETEIVGALTDGAHRGGGLNGQDVWTGRVIPCCPQVADPIITKEDATYTHEGKNFRLRNVIQEGLAVRRLTPLECERLQGFPDGWTSERLELSLEGNQWQAAGAQGTQKDGSRYKQLGNAVTVPVARWLAEQMAKALAQK